MIAINKENNSFAQFSLKQSIFFADAYKSRHIDDETRQYFEKMAETSLAQQQQMETEQTGSFDDFIKDYRSRTSSEICDGSLN